jgi:dihydrodipicolinate synthase/N-acetylneuraminate lyase
MKRLNARDIFGIWAGSVMCWDERFRFDADAYAASIKQTIKYKPHGIYTTGSTGEFYAIDLDEFKLMVDIQSRLCGEAGIPLQVGCCAEATHKSIRLLEYAASKPQVGAAQVVLPYWMELNDREVTQFFKDLYTACPDLPLVHYNVMRSKRFLHGQDYLRILEVCPSLVGVKYTSADSKFGKLQSDILETPMLSYFVGEHMLASGMQVGARGSYSSVICTNPAFMLKFYDACDLRKWEQAIKMQQHLARFFADMDKLINQFSEADSDPAVDKAMAVASGFHKAHQRCRPPYIGWRDNSVAALCELMHKSYPELVFQCNHMG